MSFVLMARNSALDLLRCVGVLLTMIAHLQLPPVGNPILSSVLNRFKIFGPVGVDLFFVLSGFLVSGLIFKEISRSGAFDARRFLIRRGFKIYPAYYFAIVVGVVLSGFSHDKFTLREVVVESLFVCNYFKAHHGWFWSISVEEHFYFFLCFLLLWMLAHGKLRFRAILGTYLILLLISISGKLYNYSVFGSFDLFRDSYKSHLRFDGLFWGVVLSWICHRDRARRNFIFRYKGLIALVSLLVLCAYWLFETYEGSPLAQMLALNVNVFALGGVLIYVLEIKNLESNMLLSKLAAIGKYSYCIYLFHQYVNQVAKRVVLPLDHTAYLLVYFISAIGFGILLSKLIEYPFLKVRDRYFPTKSIPQSSIVSG